MAPSAASVAALPVLHYPRGQRPGAAYVLDGVSLPRTDVDFVNGTTLTNLTAAFVKLGAVATTVQARGLGKTSRAFKPQPTPALCLRVRAVDPDGAGEPAVLTIALVQSLQDPGFYRFMLVRDGTAYKIVAGGSIVRAWKYAGVVIDKIAKRDAAEKCDDEF